MIDRLHNIEFACFSFHVDLLSYFIYQTGHQKQFF